MGPRPVDIHIKAIRQMGCSVSEVFNGLIKAEATNLCGTMVQLDYPSVGATENIMLLASCAQGETVIRNAAREPEIVDLQNFLNNAGFNIQGAGTNTIRIKGAKPNSFVKHRIIPDRIVAGTYLFAAAITGSDLIIKNFCTEQVTAELALLRDCGCKLEIEPEAVHIIAPQRLSAVRTIRTMPYPGFPTDMQAQTVALLSVAEGTSIVIETVFESRFKYVDDLLKMGADIKVENRMAIVRGVKVLSGTEVHAKDLRGGAALVLASLAANGKTVLSGLEYIDRGYESLDKKLTAAGASIIRSTLPEGGNGKIQKKK